MQRGGVRSGLLCNLALALVLPKVTAAKTAFCSLSKVAAPSTIRFGYLNVEGSHQPYYPSPHNRGDFAFRFDEGRYAGDSDETNWEIESDTTRHHDQLEEAKYFRLNSARFERNWFLDGSDRKRIQRQRYRNQRRFRALMNKRFSRFGTLADRTRSYTLNDAVQTDYSIFDSLRKILVKRVEEKNTVDRG